MVVDYLKPSCGGCRRLYPKLKQIAAANPDALFLKVRRPPLGPPPAVPAGAPAPCSSSGLRRPAPPHRCSHPAPCALLPQVNVDLSDELREVGQGMGVEALPWFHLFVAGGLVASFSANVATVAQLRSEIAAHKPCVDAACAF